VSELLRALQVWLLVAVVAGGPAVLLWRATGRAGLRPPQRRRAVPWSGVELLTVFLALLLWHSAAAWLAGLVWPGWRELPATRQALWASLLAWPPTVASAVLIPALASGTRPYQLGLTWHQAPVNVLRGYLAWLVSMPIVLVVHHAAEAVQRGLTHLPPQEHPLTQVARENPDAAPWHLLGATALIAAPVLEELLFRGLVQPWAARRWYGPVVVSAFAVAVAASYGPGPRGFSILLIAGLAAVEWMTRRRPSAHRDLTAVYATSMLFAVSHGNVWPTPVPLFVLSLALGFVAFRTQSLVGPIVMHVLFNGVAFVSLLQSPAGGAPEPGNGKAVATAGTLSPVGVSTARTVPGSWLPRRR
jgi:membrane protease YdiL (CAAX protease family)